MRQSNRFDAARAAAAVLLAIGLPTLTQAAGEREAPVTKAPASQAVPDGAQAPRISPVLEFLAQTIGNEQEAFASPHQPPGQPPGRPPGSPPGQNNPPNPPGKPPDRPPGHSN